MKISPEITIADFAVPDCVHEGALPVAPGTAMAPGQDNPYIGPRDYKLSELSSDELADLCENFTIAVFNKAGKTRPPTQGAIR